MALPVKKPKKVLLIDPPELSGNNLIVQEIIDTGLLRECLEYQFSKMLTMETNRWKEQFKEDLFQDLVIALLKYDNRKLNNAWYSKHMNALITRILQNQLYSTTSDFYHKYLKYLMKTNELKDIPNEEGPAKDIYKSNRRDIPDASRRR